MSINFKSGLVKFGDVYFNPEKVRYVQGIDSKNKKGTEIVFDQSFEGSGCRTASGDKIFIKHPVDKVAIAMLDAENLSTIIDLNA